MVRGDKSLEEIIIGLSGVGNLIIREIEINGNFLVVFNLPVKFLKIKNVAR